MVRPPHRYPTRLLRDLDIAGPHPDRVRDARHRAARQVRSGRVAEVPDPVRLRVAVLTLLQHIEDVLAHDPPATVLDHLAAGRVELQGDVVLVQPADDGAPSRPRLGPAAVEPEAAGVLRGDPRELLAYVGHRKFATSRAPCSDRTDSGWNCTPCSCSSRCATPITTLPVTAVIRNTSGNRVAAS